MVNKPNVLDLLPDHWNEVLERELELLDKDRPAGQKLLEQETEVRRQYATDWDSLNPLPEKDYSQAQKGKAVDWLNHKKKQLEGEKDELQQKLVQVKEKIGEQEKTVKSWAEDLQELIRALQALPGEIEKAKQQVTQKCEEWKEADQRSSGRATRLKRTLETAQEELKYLESEAQDQLNNAVSPTLKGWQGARDELKKLTVGEDAQAESQENLEIQIKQIEKKLQHFQRQEAVLLRNYLAQSVSAGNT